MSRLRGIFLGVAWLVLLLLLNTVYLLRPANVRAQVGLLLEATFGPDVRFGDVRRTDGGDVIIEAVEIPDPNSPDIVLCALDQVYVDLDWTRLLTGKLPVEEVLLERAKLTLRWNEDGELLVESPFAAGKGGGARDQIPAIVLRGLQIRLIGAPKMFDPDVWLRFKEADVELRPVSKKPGAFRIGARVNDELVGSLNVEGSLDDEGLILRVDRSGPPITPKLLELLRPDWREPLERIRLGGAFDVYASVALKGNERARLRVESMMSDVTVTRDGWPQRLDQLRGRVVFENGRVRFLDFIGRLEGGEFSGSGVLDLAGPGRLECHGALLGLKIDPSLPDRVEVLGESGASIAEQMRIFAVEGELDVDFALNVETLGQPAEPRVKVTLKDERFRFEGARSPRSGERLGIPLLMEHLSGVLHFTQRGLLFSDVSASHGAGLVEGRGWVDYERFQEERWEVGIFIAGLPLSEDLWLALGPTTGGFLRSLHLEGEAYGIIRPSQLTPPNPDPVSLDAELYDARARPEFFPFALSGLSGRVALRGEDVTLHDVSCPVGSGFLTLNGTAHTGSDAHGLDFQLNAVSVPITEDLLAALSHLLPAATTLFSKVVPGQGEFSAALHLVQAVADGPWSVEGMIEIEDLAFGLADPRVEVSLPSLVLDLHGGEIRFRKPADAVANGLPLLVDGFVRKDGGIRVTATTKDRELGPALMMLIESAVPAFSDPASRPSIEGKGQLELALEIGGRDEAGRGMLPKLSGTFSGLTVRPAGWNDTRIERLRGKVTLGPDSLQLGDVTAFIPRPAPSDGSAVPRPNPFEGWPGIDVSLGAATILFGQHADATGEPQWHLANLRVAGVPLEPWVPAMAGFTIEALDDLGVPRLAGRASFELLSLTRFSGVTHVVGGHLVMRDVSLARDAVRAVNAEFSGVTVALSAGDLDIEGQLLAEGFRVPKLGDLTADALRVDRLKIKRREGKTTIEGKLATEVVSLLLIPITGLTGTLVGDEAGIRLEQVKGAVFGGEGGKSSGAILAESTSVSYGWKTGRFGVTARVEDIPLGEAIAALGGNPGRFRGRGNLTLALSGDEGDPGSIVGNGRFVGTAQNLIELPIFLNVFRALDVVSLFQMLIRSGVATEMAMDLAIRDKIIALEQVALENSVVLLLGRGSIRFDGIVNAYLNSEFKGGIPLVSDVLNLLPSLLAGGVTVEGPISNPIVTVRSGDEGHRVGDLPDARLPITKPIKTWK